MDADIAAAVRGDRAAIARVLETIYPPVLRYCRARMNSVGTGIGPDDVAQEVCIAVLRALPRYRDHGRPFLAFVYSIASHKVVDAYRSAARQPAGPFGEIPELPSEETGPEQWVLQSETAGQLDNLLRTLPAQQQEILILRVVVGMSAIETAAAVGSTPNAVRVAQHRALAKLRGRIQAQTPRRALAHV